MWRTNSQSLKAGWKLGKHRMAEAPLKRLGVAGQYDAAVADVALIGS